MPAPMFGLVPVTITILPSSFTRSHHARGLLELGSELEQPALDDLHAERMAARRPAMTRRAMVPWAEARRRRGTARAAPAARMIPGTVKSQRVPR